MSQRRVNRHRRALFPGHWTGFLAVLAIVCCTQPLLALTPGQSLSGGGTSTRSALNPDTGLQQFLGFSRTARPRLGPPQRTGPTPDVTALARSALRAHGKPFGLLEVDSQLQHVQTLTSPSGYQAVRFRQLIAGVPVFGGDITVNIDARTRLSSIHARLAPNETRVATPAIDAESALQYARDALSRESRVAPGQLLMERRELGFYRPDLVGEQGSSLTLVWDLILRHQGAPALRQRLLIDAATGRVLLSFTLLDTARQRVTSNADQTSDLPGVQVCDEADGDACTRGLLPEADAAHVHAGDFHDFFATVHGRDSIDGRGEPLLSTVRYFAPEDCPNAFWDGVRVVYCEGVPQADDVVAHEFTHGFTERTSDLIYLNESGAINESFSDIWGEFVDLWNGTGNDHPSWRWLVGEDSSIGPVRNMADPAEFGHPDGTRSPFYYQGPGDNGGVHINSGVSNRAAVLLVEGGELNGMVVQPLDPVRLTAIEKAAALFFEVQVRMLPSSADWVDLGSALQQACADLEGTRGFTATDCVAVDNAVTATGMLQGTPALEAPSAALCPDGLEPAYALTEEFNAGIDDWTAYTEQGALPWLTSIDNPDGVAAAVHVRGSDTSGTAILLQNAGILLPPQARLHVTHFYRTELVADGGLIDLVGDDDAGIDIDSLLDAGDAPTIEILSPTSPIASRLAFTGERPRFVSSRYDLGAFEGGSPRLRFRYASDEGTSSPGWWLDAVRVYSCLTPTGHYPPTVRAGADITVQGGARVSLQGSLSDPDGTIESFSWQILSGPAVTLEQAETLAPSFVTPAVEDPQIISLALTATDDQGISNTGRVRVTVNPDNLRPVVSAGGNRSVVAGTTVELSGSVEDEDDGSFVSVSWTQVSGDPVVLETADSITTRFTAPGVMDAQALVFRLSAVDSGGARGEDELTVIVRPAADVSGGGAGGGTNGLVYLESGGRAGAALDAGALLASLFAAWCLRTARRRSRHSITRR